MLKCPNNHSISHVLVCGGENPNQEGNVYFQMSLDGKYTNLLADGTSGVTEEMTNHADGGCSEEPICPVCKEVCIPSSQTG